jgi:hypothetical protein
MTMFDDGNVSVADTVSLDEEFTDVPVSHSDVGASVPSPEEVRNTVNMHSRSSGGSGRFLKSVIGSVVIAALVIGVIIGVSGGGGNSSSSSQRGSAVRQSTAEEIITYMANSGVSDLTALTSDGSPQSRAATWMAETDEANLPIPTGDGIESYKYTTRYAMVVLYYATGGDTTWTNQLSFMSSTDVCNWYGIFQSAASAYRKGVVCDTDTGLITGLGISK